MGQVLILGGDSDHNLGDDAILTALCQCLAARRPGVDIVISGAAGRRLPGSTVRGVVPRGLRGLVPQLRAAVASERVIIAGGGLFQDDDSRIKMPFWATRLMLLRATGTHLAGIAIGAGPLVHRESGVTARWACRQMERFSVRDEPARRDLQRCTTRPVRVVPDAAFMLAPASDAAALAVLRRCGVPAGRPLIGLALRRWFHPLGGFVPHRLRARMGRKAQGPEERLMAFIAQIGAVIRRIAADLDADLLLLPTYNVAHEADHAVGRLLRAAVPGLHVHEAIIDDPTLYKAVTGRLRLLVSARMHPMVLAAGMGIPVVGLAYNQKFGGLFEMLGLPQRMTWLDEHARQPGEASSRFEAQVRDALAGGDDGTVERCARLAAQTERELLAIVDGEPVPEANA